MPPTSDFKLLDEAGRLAALERYQVMDSEPETGFDKITALVQKVLQAPMVAVSLLDTERQWFKSRQGLAVCETKRGVSFCRHTIRSPEHMLVRDALHDPLFSESTLVTGPPYIRSYLGFPLRTPDGYQLGALCVLDTVPRDYDVKQIEILRSFAELVENELELRLVARSDHLTGIMTRRAFIEEMARSINQFKRHQRASSLITFDIDHFKRVNDTFGHPAGDITLRAVTEACRWTLRRNETFGRVGGEEFGVLVVESTLNEAMQAAERLRGIIETLSVPHEPPISITASFGVAQYARDFDNCEKWMAAADRALYAAKAAGRNRCNAFSRTHPPRETVLP